MAEKVMRVDYEDELVWNAVTNVPYVSKGVAVL